MSEEAGPVVGESAPDFTLPDEQNRATPLEATIGEKGVLLAFLHGTWCMACVQAMYRLRRHERVYAGQGVNVAVVAIDPPGKLYTFKISADPPIPFPLLADEDRAVHRRYGLERMGAYLLIEREGVVRAKFLDTDHQGWPGHGKILAAFQTHLL